MNRQLSDLLEDRFGEPQQAGQNAPADGVLAQLLKHRSIRHFQDRAISSELMEILLSSALSAPSKSDLQQATVIHVTDVELRAKICALVPSMPWAARAPGLLVFCGDNLRLRQAAALRGKPFRNDTLDMFMNAAVDAAMVMQSFITAAESVGLGCCPLSYIRNQIDRLADLLQLPEAVFPIAGLCVGYPADPGKVSMRLPTSVTVHQNTYQKDAFLNGVSAYDTRRASKEPWSVGMQKYVNQWGVADNYCWSEDKARQYSVPERHDFGSFVRRIGFSLK